MNKQYKVYKGLEFIRKTTHGEIDIEKSKNIVREIALAASSHSVNNIILDLRDTKTVLNFGDLLAVTMEFQEYPQALDGKIAVIIPKEEKRIKNVEFMKQTMTLKGLSMEYFFNYEDAIDWF